MATLDVGRTVTTKKDHPMMSEVALTECRMVRQAATYSVRHSRKTQASRKAKWRRGPLSPPGQTNPDDLVSGSARLTPRTRPCPAREGGPRVAHTRHQGPYPRVDAYRHRDSDGHLRTLVGRSAPSSAQALGIGPSYGHVCFGRAHTLFGQDPILDPSSMRGEL